MIEFCLQKSAYTQKFDTRIIGQKSFKNIHGCEFWN